MYYRHACISNLQLLILLLVNILACCRQRIRRINIITIRVIRYHIHHHQQHGSIKEDTKQQSRHRWHKEVRDDDCKEEVKDYIGEEACI